MAPDPIELRLAHQLDAVPFALGTASADALSKRPATGKWSAREHLAHLARYHEVMMARLHRILTEETPRLERYRAEQDPGWETWSKMELPAIRQRLPVLRAALVAEIDALSGSDRRRVGIHGTYGPMTILEWTEFFLLHEAHHLYVIMGLRGSAE